MTQLEIKNTLRIVCVDFVLSRLQTIHNIVQSNQDALDSESKSSAGDKHETGRAMLQLEMEKAGQQLSGVQQMKLIVEKIDSSKFSKVGSLGSVIRTEEVNYFIGISVGKVEVENETYFVVSPSSPIGKLLLGKVTNDDFLFQGRQTKISEIY
jgi:transcription elongation GreA/GreB family factor